MFRIGQNQSIFHFVIGLPIDHIAGRGDGGMGSEMQANNVRSLVAI